jgi:hypothetical protein
VPEVLMGVGPRNAPGGSLGMRREGGMVIASHFRTSWAGVEGIGAKDGGRCPAMGLDRASWGSYILSSQNNIVDQSK